MHVGGYCSNLLSRSLVPIPRTESSDPIPRTVRPSAAGATPPRDAHVQGGAPGGGLLGPATRPGGGLAARVVVLHVYPFGVRPSLYIGARGVTSTLEAIGLFGSHPNRILSIFQSDHIRIGSFHIRFGSHPNRLLSP